MVIIGSIAASCAADPTDDRFARTFLEHLRHGEPAGENFLEPNGELSQIGLDSLSKAVANYLPAGRLDSIQLQSWQSGIDAHGPHKKLTYLFYRDGIQATASVWVVKRHGKPFVSTLTVGRASATGQ